MRPVFSGSIGGLFLLLAAWSLHAADVEFYAVIKMQRFEQGNAIAPSLREFDDSDPGDTAPFVFNAFADLTGSNAVTAAKVTLPGGAMRTLPLIDDGMTRGFTDFQEFKPDLDTVYSNSTYTLFLQTQNDSDKTIALAFPPGDDYPNPPRVNNWTEAQSINPAAGVTLAWDTFNGGQTTDFVQLRIADSDTDTICFETFGPGEPGSLNGTSMSVQIPGGTLPAGRTLDAQLMFARIVDVDDATYGDGVTGVAAFVVGTTFQVETTGGTDLKPPGLQSHFPQDMRTDVGARTTVSFTFSETMNSGLPIGASITWSSNLDPGQFTYAWSAEDRALFCICPPGFPANATISWELNPAGSPQNLRDLAGNKLATQSGTFTTSSNADEGVNDLQSVVVAKGRLFLQTSNGVVDLESYQFNLTSEVNILNSQTNALLTLPDARTISAGPDFGDSLDLTTQYSSQEQLDLFFPDGTYQVRSDQIHDGSVTYSLALSGGAYPNAPVIQDYATAQLVNPSNTFVLSWNNFSAGTTNDFIGLDIQSEGDFDETVFGTPDFSEATALVGTNTSVTLPAFTLAPGRTYHGQLFFAKVSQLDTNTYPGVPGAAAHFTATEFELQASGEVIQPSLQISRGSNGAVHIVVTGERNRYYTIESSDSLDDAAEWSWWNGGYASDNVSGFTGSFQFDDHVPFFSGTLFYRAREGY